MKTIAEIAREVAGELVNGDDATYEVMIAEKALENYLAQMEPIATIHSDGYWTHPVGKDPLGQYSQKAKLDVFLAPSIPAGMIPSLLLEAHDYGQFADDFDQPLAKPIRKAIREMLNAEKEKCHG